MNCRFRVLRLAIASGLCTTLIGAALWAQTKDPIDPAHAAKMAKGLDVFKQHVRPLLEQKCLRCHGGKSVENDFDLSDREHLLKGGESGPAVLLGKSKESLLYKLITH